MNERIRELADEARIKFSAHWAHEGVDTAVITRLDLKEFAELIVRECMAQCEQVAEDADAMAKSTFVTDVGRMIHEGAWGGAKNCGVQIQTHFGVEQ
jgi:hypothetical protein